MQFPEEVRDQIPRWKRMGYEPHCVSVPSISGDQVVVFRTLTKKEFVEITQSPLREVPEEANFLGTLYSDSYAEIVELAVLWPKPLPEELSAASDKIIADAIIDASAWVSTDRLVNGLSEARESASSLDGFLRSRIFAAFPTMTTEQVDNLRFSEMINLVATSEVITGVVVDLRPWLDPEGYQAEMDRQQRMHRRIQKERELGVNVDPRMRDPEFRRKLIEQAQESRTRLNSSRSQEDIDLEKMNKQLAQAKNG